MRHYRRDESYFSPLWIYSGTEAGRAGWVLRFLATKPRYGVDEVASSPCPSNIRWISCDLRLAESHVEDCLVFVWRITRKHRGRCGDASLMRLNPFARWVARFDRWRQSCSDTSTVYSLPATRLRFFLSALEWSIDEQMIHRLVKASDDARGPPHKGCPTRPTYEKLLLTLRGTEGKRGGCFKCVAIFFRDESRVDNLSALKEISEIRSASTMFYKICE